MFVFKIEAVITEDECYFHKGNVSENTTIISRRYPKWGLTMLLSGAIV